jgi:hypothetical protein
MCDCSKYDAVCRSAEQAKNWQRSGRSDAKEDGSNRDPPLESGRKLVSPPMMESTAQENFSDAEFGIRNRPAEGNCRLTGESLNEPDMNGELMMADCFRLRFRSLHMSLR